MRPKVSINTIGIDPTIHHRLCPADRPANWEEKILFYMLWGGSPCTNRFTLFQGFRRKVCSFSFLLLHHWRYYLISVVYVSADAREYLVWKVIKPNTTMKYQTEGPQIFQK
jgi:hypothetical protein